MAAKVLCALAVLLIIIKMSAGQNYTYSCRENWCGEKWKSNDRIQLYNYTIEYDNITILTNRTYTTVCSALDILLNNCEPENITEEEEIIIETSTYAREPKPLIKEIPEELKIQLIATENIASGIYNDSTENYKILNDKVWQVWIPRGCRMVMFFTEFDLESSPDCSKDFFSIQTSKKQQDIIKYCGSVGEIANKTISIRNRRRVQLHFRSDEDHTRRGVKAAYCFQDLKTYDADVPCGCNTDTSSVRRSLRHTRKAGKPKGGKPKTGKPRTKTHTKHQPKHNSKSGSKARLNKDLLFAMQADQDQRISQIVRSMMQEGLKAINHYRFSNNRMERLLAENYQRAMHSQAI